MTLSNLFPGATRWPVCGHGAIGRRRECPDLSIRRSTEWQSPSFSDQQLSFAS
jgi:hypothetical protein